MRVMVAGEPAGLLGYRAPLLSGDRGTAQTIALMRNLVDQALSDPEFIRFAVDTVRHVPAHDNLSEIAAIFNWVQSNIRYTMDPVTKEKLYPPQELLKIRAGDCDDVSMLIGAMALALGYTARLVTVSTSPDASEFSHVYPEVEIAPGAGQWVALDVARPNSYLGRQPEVYFRRREWSLIDGSYKDVKGLSGYCDVNDAVVQRQLAGLGYDGGGDGIDWSSILSQSIAQTPQIIAAVQGQPTSMRLPSGTSVGTGPYASFATQYTPGYALPAAGYSTLQQASGNIFSSALPWILAGLVAVAVFRR